MILVKNVRLSFPQLFNPRSFEGEAQAKYSAVFLLPKGSEQAKQVEAEIRRVATDAFGDKARMVIEKQNSTNRKLLKDGDAPEGFTTAGEQKNGYEGHLFIKGTSVTAPKIVGRNKQLLTEADGIPYAGCMVNVQLDIWAQKNKFGTAVNCKLLAVQFWEDGERLGGASGANLDAFDAADTFDSDIAW